MAHKACYHAQTNRAITANYEWKGLALECQIDLVSYTSGNPDHGCQVLLMAMFSIWMEAYQREIAVINDLKTNGLKVCNHSGIAQILWCFFLTRPVSTCTGRYADEGDALFHAWFSDRIV